MRKLIADAVEMILEDEFIRVSKKIDKAEWDADNPLFTQHSALHACSALIAYLRTGEKAHLDEALRWATRAKENAERENAKNKKED